MYPIAESAKRHNERYLDLFTKITFHTIMIYKIQANTSGTRNIEVTDEHLESIEKYALLRNLIDSNGIIDEAVLDKLKFNLRSLLESDEGRDKALLDLCLDVIYNSNMKAFGLHQLVLLYLDWKSKQKTVGE
jgi:hypothetical protein